MMEKSKPRLRVIEGTDEVGFEPPGGGSSFSSNLPIEFSEDALAKEHADQCCADRRAIKGTNEIRAWNGHVWQPRAFEQERHDVREGVCRNAANRIDNQTLARDLSSKARASNVMHLAMGDPRILIDAEKFDANPMLVNHPSAVTDLRSGASLEQSRDQMMTKMTAADPASSAPCFRQLLTDVTRADLELSRFMQRAVGYSLTGSISEHAIFCLFGPGGTGKSVFLNAVCEAFGDYGRHAPMDLFISQTGERHPADLAALRSSRILVATETEEGKRFDEAKVKSMSGGDPITARFMRGDPFTYRPEFKIWLATNHLPRMRSADDAMRRRLHIIPFPHKPATIDKALPLKLRAELGGILRWAIEGCIEWQRIGLAPPPPVIAATNDYFDAENVLGHWLEERCVTSREHATPTKKLFGDFAEWGKRAGEFVGSERAFAQKLLAAGFQRWRDGRTQERGFKGIALSRSGNELPLDASVRAMMGVFSITIRRAGKNGGTTRGTTMNANRIGAPSTSAASFRFPGDTRAPARYKKRNRLVVAEVDGLAAAIGDNPLEIGRLFGHSAPKTLRTIKCADLFSRADDKSAALCWGPLCWGLLSDVEVDPVAGCRTANRAARAQRAR
jgi:putative DNA primase/helicase